jgi:hypothetical protein
MMEKLKPYGWLLAGLVVLAVAWHYFKPAPAAPTGTFSEGKESPDVGGMTKRPIQGKVTVLPQSAKTKTNLPQAVQDDPSKHIVDTASFPITDRPFTAVATYDEQSGDVSISARNDPLPWLAAENRWYIRFGGGVKTRSGTVGKIAVGGNLVQVKALHVGVEADLYTDGDAYAGAHVEYQF